MAPGGFCIFKGPVPDAPHAPRGHTGELHMNQDTTPHDVSKIRVVYAMPTADAVRIRRDQEYLATDAGALAMDLYYPPDASGGSRTPAVIFVTGFSDDGARRIF